MHYPDIHRVLTQEPLAIVPTAHASWLSRFEAYLEFRSRSVERVEQASSLSPLRFDAANRDVEIFGQTVERPQAEIEDGIMFLPVGGPVGRGLGKVEKACGCVDYSEILADLDEMESDPNCRGCIILWDSPGGMVQGGNAVKNRILACEKTILSHCEGLMGSQAYFLACCADGVFATDDARVGSIGVYCYALDRSKQYADAGLKPLLITSGKYKGMGAPGIPMSKDQIELLQSEVDDLAEKFYTHVDDMRSGNVSREDMQGQVFTGEKAFAKGLIDDVVTGLDDVVALLK
jgi:ClpP class serine protease